MVRLARPLLYLGFAGSVLGLAKLHAAAVADEHYDFTSSFRFGWSLLLTGLLCVGAYALGLPDAATSRRSAAVRGALVATAAAGGVGALQLVAGTALLPRFVVFGTVALAVPWTLLCSALSRDGRERATGRDRVLLVATDGEATALRDELHASPERPALLVDHLNPAEALPLGTRPRPVVERATAARATVLVLDRAALLEPAIVAQVATLHAGGCRVRTLTSFYGEWLGKLPVSELERASLLFDISELHRTGYAPLKRLGDVVAAAAGALVLLAALPVVAAGNLLGNRGPLLYRQERVGKGGRTFTMLKLRTMRADDTAPTDWTGEHDPRITRFGRWLRRTHVDELPQVVNVLRGDLSIVGPRPEQPRYVEELSDKLPFYDLRHLVRPGLTGWAQVKYGYAGDERDALEKLQYEFWYLERQSLALDLRIAGRTVRSVAGGCGSGR